MTSGQPPSPEPSAIGTQRRLRALAARSWSPEAIERETGIPSQLISLALGRADDITSDLAGAVAAAYDRLWDREPPAATRDDQQAAGMAALRAARRGWAPPWPGTTTRSTCPAGGPSPAGNPASEPPSELLTSSRTPPSSASAAATGTRPCPRSPCG
jgi:hypothetical protein